MNIVVTSATHFEVQQIREAIEQLYKEAPGFTINFHTSGVGILSSTFSLLGMINKQPPDLVIQVGIAGCFNSNIELGSVLAVKDEFIGDMGVEENGHFKDVFDLNLDNKDNFPFTNKALNNPWLLKYNLLKLQEVAGVTVNEITTKTDRIKELEAKYKPVSESMEGASLHYVCLQTSTPFIQMRATSNYIGERDKSKWQIKLALANLTKVTVDYLAELYKLDS